MNATTDDEIRAAVRQRYSRVAESDSAGCGTACCEAPAVDAGLLSQRIGYTQEELDSVPKGSNLGLGCGNPRAIASLAPGETVLDLGSGAGFDCFLAIQQVGESGRVIGVDMTAEMVTKARRHAEKAGYHNVEFRLGEIERLPVVDASVDVVISNCVINLSPNKPQVFAEAYRVLRRGGRLAVSDIVATAELPPEVREDLAHYTGCMAGALTVGELESMLRAAGFDHVSITEKDGGSAFMREWDPDRNPDDFLMSADIRAVRPAG